jgi:endonuclease/exonuclease/phosphatase family metal-dependent hydrolase
MTGEPVSLRVMTYNIHSATGSGGSPDLQRIAADIAGADVDLVALQEVDARTKRADGIDQARELAASLGMDYVFGRSRWWIGPGRVGNAVLSRFPITRHRNRRLPGSRLRVSRKLLEVAVCVPETGEQWLFLSTHFSLDAGDRLRAARWIAQTYASKDETIILTGDFNESPAGPAVTTLEQWFDRADTGPTYPASSPAVAIDAVMAGPRDRVRIEAAGLGPPSISDHRSVIVSVLALPRTSPAAR